MKSKISSRVLLAGVAVCVLAHLFVLPFCCDWRGSGISAIFVHRSLGKRIRIVFRAWQKQSLKPMSYVYGRLSHWVGYSPNPGDGVYGREGWVFLGNNYEHSLDQVHHRYADAPAAVARLTQQSLALAACAEANGAKMLILVAPNKGSLYPELLPGRVLPGPSLLTQWRERVPALVLDVEGALLAKKAEVALASPYNTHWSDAAAGIAWDVLRERLGTWWDVSACYQAWGKPIGQRWEAGDLPNILRFRAQNSVATLPRPATVGTYTLRGEAAQAIEGPWVQEATSGDAHIRHPGAPLQKRLLVIGDSNVAAISPYLNAAFSEVCYRSYYGACGAREVVPAVEAFLKETSPDLLLWVVAERHLPEMW